MEICCVSDLHGFFPDVGSGDLLIVCGDLTARDEHWEYIAFRNWCNNQKYKKVIVIAGNHDNYLQHHKWSINHEIDNIEYLCDSATEFEGLKIYGTPWSLTFPDMNPKCKAFTVDTEQELSEKWAKIPDDIDILITHTPPYGILDTVTKSSYEDCGTKLTTRRNVGSICLRGILLHRTKNVKLHVFGHIHESYGEAKFMTEIQDGWSECIEVNASYVNERYQPVNKPIRVIL